MYCHLQRTGTALVCEDCGRSIVTSRAPHECYVFCHKPRHEVELTTTGKLLASMKPGDGVKWLADHTGLSWFVDPAKCGCADRQAWLNNQWQRFVVSHFAERGENVSPFARSGTQGGSADT
jgi:hypothetical protein